MKALVLSGGGSKGAYQLGVLRKWMGEQGNDYEIMTGVSVGALNVAGLSQVAYGNPKDAIEWVIELWLKHVETKTIYRRWYPFGMAHGLFKTSFYDTTPLRELLEKHFDRDKALNCGRQIAVGAVSLETGENRFAMHDDPMFIDWVLASSSYPIFFKPIEIDGQIWSDGGVKNITPLGQAIRMGATEIDVIMCSNPWLRSNWGSKKKRAFPDQVLRVMELMNEKIGQDDIRLTGLKNDLANLGEDYRHVKINIVHPHKNLGINALEFNRNEIKMMIEKGYEDADNVVVYE